MVVMVSIPAGIVRHQVSHVRTTSALEALARWCGLRESVGSVAAAKLRSGEVTGLLVSGPQGSGKDTIAPAVLTEVGVRNPRPCRISHGIREEMTTILQILASHSSPEQATREVAGTLELADEYAASYVERFFPHTRDPDDLPDVYARSELMRRALQFHGAEARADRPGYWIQKAYQTILPALAGGESVMLTDGRFPGEVDAGRTAGIFCIRLWVPEDVRIERIRGRDGFEPSLESLRHPGETVLDGYWGLDVELDNTAPLVDVVRAAATLLTRHRTRISTTL
jgi:hypothetical protein